MGFEESAEQLQNEAVVRKEVSKTDSIDEMLRPLASMQELFQKHRSRDRRRKNISIESVSAIANKQPLRLGGVDSVVSGQVKDRTENSEDKAFDSLFYESFDDGSNRSAKASHGYLLGD